MGGGTASQESVSRGSVSRGDAGVAGPGADGRAGIEGFAVAARALADATRVAGLVVPAFRSPPRIVGVDRSLRRYPGGTVVSVRLRGRSLDAMVADMIEGVVVTNRLTGEPALRARTFLAEAVSAVVPADSWGPGAPPSEEARVVDGRTQAA